MRVSAVGKEKSGEDPSFLFWMPRPVGLICYICGREYGSASIDIHVKQCRKLWVEREKLKPEKQRRPLPVEPKVLGATFSSSSSFDRDALNDAAFTSFNDQALVQCGACGRTFLPDALAHHQKACTRARPLFKKRNAAMAGRDVRMRKNATAPAAVCISAAPRVPTDGGEQSTPKSSSSSSSAAASRQHQTLPPDQDHANESLASRVSRLEAMAEAQSREVLELRRIVVEQQEQLARTSSKRRNQESVS